MQRLDAAHITILDVELLVVFVDARPGADLAIAVQRSAKDAGYACDVILVWADEMGRTRFLAREEQHAFFQIAGYDQLRAQVNAHIDCAD